MLRDLALLFAAALSLCGADYDLLIRNARVIDGSGNPWFRADVAVKDGRIAAIGRLDGRSAARTIDAAERVVAPGFIDVHTHIEGVVERFPRADNFLFDGVTTVVTGNCGGSRTDLETWFSALDKAHPGINVASLIGHNSVRAAVMGTGNRAPTAAEMKRMEQLVDKNMRDGAVGFSTGLIYIPGTYADTAEVVALAKVAGQRGGVYASHMRDEGQHIIEAIEEAVTVGREAHMPVELSHFKIDTKGLWGKSVETLALVDKYRREGLDVVVDQYPYDRSSTNLGTTLPSWALADGDAEVNARIADGAERKKIIAEMKEMLSRKGHDDYTYALVAQYKPDPSYEGKTIPEITAARGRPATVDAQIDTILDMIGRGGAQMIYHSMGAEDVDRILRYPNTAVASDGGVRELGAGMPHPRSYGTNARVLAEYVRNRGVITLEDAIRRMTSLPARTFGFRDRGVIREGAAADLLLFDPAAVQDRATYAQPHQYSTGFDAVIVNGVVELEDGKTTDLRGGKVLRRQNAQ